MKITLWLLSVLCASLLLFAGCAEPVEEDEVVATEIETEAPEPEPFDVAELKQRIDAGEELFLLDVRTAEELQEHGMIEGAVHIPIDELEENLSQVPADQPIVTYCMGGGRASEAAEILRENGYEQPILYGGLTEWKDAGYPVVEPEEVE